MKNTLLILLLCLSTFLNAQITDLGLIAYYDFENNANNQFSGNSGFNLTTFGVPPTILNTGDGVNGSECYTFFGNGGLATTDFFNLLENNPNQSLSISVWAKAELPSGNQIGSIFEFFESMFIRGNSFLNYGINTSSNNTVFTLADEATYIQGNSFQHHVLVFDHTNQRLNYYRDGQLRSSVNTTSGVINRIQQNAVFGGGVDAGGNFSNSKGFVGKLDEIYIYNRPLVQSEVTSLYNLETPLTIDSISGDDLLAYYSFNSNMQNQAPGATQFNLSFVGNSNQGMVPSTGITGGDINNNVAYLFSGASALSTDDFGSYFANSASQDVSISMWLNSSSSSGIRTLIEMFSSVFLRGVGEYGISTLNGAFDLNLNSVLGNSQFQHVSLIFDSQNTTLSFYLNGFLQSSISTDTGNIVRYNAKTVIGGGTNTDGSMNNSKYFIGILDEVYIFNRVLSPGEVAAFANKLVPSAPAPPCPSGDVTLSNQTEVNDFVAQYSSCTTIEGNLTITGSVSDLSSLTSITTVNGNLEIINTSSLSGLNGLHNISIISGDLSVIGNASLTNIDQLTNITSVARLDIWFNPLLQNISGLSGLVNVSNNIFIDSNDSLTSLNGLQGISGTHPASISIDNNNALTSLNGLQNIVQIGGRLRLRDNALLSDISALSNFQGSGVLFSLALLIENNDALISLNGLQNYTNANNNTVRIEENDNLADVSALANLNPNSVANLTILNNPSLATCNINFVCNFLTINIANTNISGNAPGCESLATVQNQCQSTGPVCPQVSTLVFTTQAEVDAFVNQYPNCDVLNSLLIEGSVTDVSGLANLTSINGFFTVSNAPNLTSLSGLQNITQVTERVLISDCPLVTDLTGLSSLQISGIGTNVSALIIQSMNGLTSLNGLENYANANSKRVTIANNINLTDISAIGNLDANTVGQLNILGNSQLSVCSNSLVCDKLISTAPTFQNIVIFSNGVGCATEVEAFNLCQSLSIETFYHNATRIYPNPFTNSINIQLPEGFDRASVKIMNVEGKVVFSNEVRSNLSTINQLQSLNKGLYFMQVTLPTGKQLTYKLVK